MRVFSMNTQCQPINALSFAKSLSGTLVDWPVAYTIDLRPGYMQGAPRTRCLFFVFAGEDGFNPHPKNVHDKPADKQHDQKFRDIVLRNIVDQT